MLSLKSLSRKNPKNYTIDYIVINHFLPEKRQRRRTSTVDGYEGSYKKYIRPVFGDTKIKDMRTSDIQRFIDSFESKGAAYKCYSTLRCVVRWAIAKWDLDIADPMKGLELPRKEVYRPETLTVKEVNERVEGFKGFKYEPTVIIAHDLGTRPGENYALDWEDIDFNTGRVYICKTLQYASKGLELWLPKNKFSERYVFLSDPALNRLREIWLERGEPSGRIIQDAYPGHVSNAIKSYARKHHLPEVTMKNCRHTWGTNAAEAGVPIETIAQAMGHSTISITYSNYIQRRESSLKKAQKSIQEMSSDNLG